jgi:hypothetical protein
MIDYRQMLVDNFNRIDEPPAPLSWLDYKNARNLDAWKRRAGLGITTGDCNMNDEQKRLWMGIVNALGLSLALVICVWAFWRFL